MIKLLVSMMCMGVLVWGQFDLQLRNLLVTNELRVQSGNYRVGLRAPSVAPSSNLIWRMPNADIAGCLQSDGSLNLAFSSCAGLPVVDTTNIVFGSSDNTKRLRFEVDGFTTATDRVLTPQDANYVIAGTNIAQTFSATQTFDSHIRFGTHNTWEIGSPSVQPSVIYAVNADFASAALGGTYTNVRKLNLYDVGTSSAFWDLQASAGLNAFFWLRDQGGSRAMQFERIVSGAPVNTLKIYSDVLPARRLIANGDFVNDTVNPTIGNPLNRWREGWFIDLDIGNKLDVQGTATFFGTVFATGNVIPSTDGFGNVGAPGFRYGAGHFVNLTVSGTCTGCGSVPVVDTTNIVFGSGDNTKRARFEVDGFTSGANRVMTLPNADATLAGINVAQNWSATQAFQDINSFSAGSHTIGLINHFAQVRANQFDGTTSAIPGTNWMRTRKLEIWDEIGGSGFWHFQTRANAFDSYLDLRDNSGNIRVSFQSLLFTAPVQQGVIYGNWVPDAPFSRTLGLSSNRWDILWGRFASLRSNGSFLASFVARDTSDNVVFSMGDSGGFGGEFAVRNSSLAEFFGAVNGTLRYNGNNGLTTNVTCPAGQAIKSMRTEQGGVITFTCAVP